MKEGKLIPVFYDPNFDGKDFSVPAYMKDHAILPFHELYRSIKGTMPSGELWEAYKSILLVNGTMYRMLALPPGAPQDAVNALRAAVVKLAADKSYIDEAHKLMGDVPEYVTSPRSTTTSAPPCRSTRRSRRSWTPTPSGRRNSQRSRPINQCYPYLWMISVWPPTG